MKGKKTLNLKLVLMVLVCVLFGFFIGAFINMFFHELGHYSFAYIFNKSAIKGFEFYPYSVIQEMIPFQQITDIHKITYKGSVFDLFTYPQAVLIFFGGLIFQLVIFVLAIILLENVTKRFEGRLNKRSFLIFCLLLGFFAAFISVTYGSTADINKVFMTIVGDVYIRLVMVMLIVMPLTLIYGRFLMRYINFYFSFLKRVIKGVRY